MKTTYPLILAFLAGCSSFTVVDQGGDFPGNYSSACEDGTASYDCCTNTSSEWATSLSELETILTEDVQTVPDVSVDSAWFDDRSALVIWTEYCNSTPWRIAVTSWRANAAQVDLDVEVRAPSDQGDTSGYRPFVVLGTQADHAGKPVEIDATLVP